MNSLKQIKEALKKLPIVIPRHTDQGHFYELQQPAETYPVIASNIFPSVTGKLAILKDEGLMNWKANKALEYVFSEFKSFTDTNILDHIEQAKNVSVQIFEDAGDVGTEVHAVRERYFREWILSGVRPRKPLSDYIPEEMKVDTRIISAVRAIEKFLEDTGYVPVACEMYLADPKLELGGQLDDIGLIPVAQRGANQHTNCVDLDLVVDMERLKINCIACGAKWKYELVLMDLKTSNQIKYHYFFQLAMYYKMFTGWTKLRIKRSFILHVSKENGQYKIKEVPNIRQLLPFTRAILKVNQGIELAKSLLKQETFKI